jgi:hypothetical protein
MPIRTNLLEELVFFTTNQGPAPILDIWSALALPIVHAAIELGLFDALHAAPATAQEAATRLQIDSRGAEMLLPALEGLGYLRQRAGRYRLAPMTAKWLREGGSINFAQGFAFFGAMVPALWHNLADTLRSGAPPTHLYAWVEDRPEVSHAFQTWMVGLARYGQAEVVQRVPLPSHATRLLDVGGGHALYSIGFCNHYPALYATVFDSPRALESAQANIAEADLHARISTHAGDFTVDPLPAGQDVVLLFNIIHGLSAAQNQALVSKAAAALSPGGMLVLMEQLAGGGVGPASRAVTSLLGLNYYHLLGGQIYPYDAVAGWLEQAGLGDLRRVDLRKTPGVTLLIGVLR